MITLPGGCRGIEAGALTDDFGVSVPMHRYKSIGSLALALALIAAPAHAQGRGGGGDNPPDVPRPGAGRADGASDRRAASPVSHELAASMHEINQAAFTQKRELLSELDLRLKASRDAIKRLQSAAKSLSAEARAEFKAPLAEVKQREKELHAALKKVRRAGAANWDASRSELARAYQNYAGAFASAEAVPLRNDR